MNMVGIVILNYNNWLDTINCVKSVELYNTHPIKFIIVDNCSTNNSSQELDEYFSNLNDYIRIEEHESTNIKKFPRYTLVKTVKNYGYAGGNNVALNIIEQDDDITHIMILNNDILFTDDIISGLVNEISKNTGIISPILYKKDGKTIDRNCARKNVSIWSTIKMYLLHLVRLRMRNESSYLLSDDKTPPHQNIEIELPSGSCMVIAKEVFKQINYFDPNTFLYWEENILHRKLEQIRKKSYLSPKYSCIHIGASSTSSSPSIRLIKSNINSCLYYYKTYDRCHILSLLILKCITSTYLAAYAVTKFVRKEN